jgi:hypothetical protein
MKSLRILVLLISAAALVSGCSNDEPASPSGPGGNTLSAGDNPAAPAGLVSDAYYSYADDGFLYGKFESISKQDGAGTVLGTLNYELYTDGATYFGWTPFGLAFDVDGTVYITQNVAAFDPGLVRSQLARVDAQTGAVTPIGDPVPFNTSGPDIDACGNMYVCGFQVDKLGYLWGNSSLWRVDKQTGAFIEVGNTGHTHWMDLAFDRSGTLWGTFDNALYTIDTATGASSFVTAVNGIPDAGAPRHMEIMSIAFDAGNVLYGTCMTTEYYDPNGSPVLRIDTATGNATLLGYTHQGYNHGGDIMPTTVRIAHRTGSGDFRCLTISMDALSSHLAHGDFVPGTDGHDCDCERAGKDASEH